MVQRWEHLLFAHWEVTPEAVQRTLPEELTVDTWEGRAFVGVVPFWMRGIRPCGFPAVPWLSNFLELNVRTYVHDRAGNPGVWFYSLDCSQPVAVWLARAQFGLPYHHARMNAARSKAGVVRYRSQRWQSAAEGMFSYRCGAAQPVAVQGSLEFFLVERYLLFAEHRGRLLRGQVHHAPYGLCEIDEAAIAITGLAPAGLECAGPPVHMAGSPGVQVEVFSPEWVGDSRFSPRP